ncbi:unnamed protein product [Pylaiella littoralis]
MTVVNLGLAQREALFRSTPCGRGREGSPHLHHVYTGGGCGHRCAGMCRPHGSPKHSPPPQGHRCRFVRLSAHGCHEYFSILHRLPPGPFGRPTHGHGLYH